MRFDRTFHSPGYEGQCLLYNVPASRGLGPQLVSHLIANTEGNQKSIDNFLRNSYQ